MCLTYLANDLCVLMLRSRVGARLHDGVPTSEVLPPSTAGPPSPRPPASNPPPPDPMHGTPTRDPAFGPPPLGPPTFSRSGAPTFLIFEHVAHLFFFCAFLIVSVSCLFLFEIFTVFVFCWFFFIFSSSGGGEANRNPNLDSSLGRAAQLNRRALDIGTVILRSLQHSAFMESSTPHDPPTSCGEGGHTSTKSCMISCGASSIQVPCPLSSATSTSPRERNGPRHC